MLQKAKELFAIRKQTSQKVLPQNLLYSKRKDQSAKGDHRALKFNVNLIFNKGQYKSVPDSPPQLQKRKEEMRLLFLNPKIDMNKLRDAAWKGIEFERGLAWKMLLGVLTGNIAEHQNQRRRLRDNYDALLKLNALETCSRRNLIGIDLKRTYTEIEFMRQPQIVELLTRVLCLWDLTGTGGYLQGMSDLAAILLMALVGYDEHPNITFEVSSKELALLESDLYFMCYGVFIKFFSYYSIGDKGALEGILKRILRIVRTADECLGEHFENHSVELIQFAFRWIYVMLSREIPLRLVFRLWDSYFSLDDFTRLHSCVVASLLLRFSLQLLKLETFGEMMKLLQALPTQEWSKKDVEMLVQQAMVLMSIFAE